ncbi:MAG TPA: hypothetical protein VFJ90_12235 [Candidatus Didemnitutus sp.]|nr:hypothetical protein [Candidatus Didemnitutus sp.]
MDPVPVSPAPRRRRIWPWVLAICLAPFVVLAVFAASVVTLSRDAWILRRHVMSATNSGWHTKVQLSVPGIVVSAVRTGLCCVHSPDIDEAKVALKAVKNASVGVYELDDPRHADWSREQLFAETDKAMQRRGWVRMVGVVDHNDAVLVYVPQDLDTDEPVDLCVAVVNNRELVVCSTTLDFDQVAKFAERHMKDGFAGRLKLAKFSLK